MSSSKKSPEKNSSLEKNPTLEGPELRHRAGGGAAAARPITITASSFFPTVTSAPNLASLNSNGPEHKTNTSLRTPDYKPNTNSRGSAPRPRMPEPPSDLPGELVNVIHVPSPAPPPTTRTGRTIRRPAHLMDYDVFPITWAQVAATPLSSD